MPPSQITQAVAELIEANTHSFIVKIWLEETVAETGRTVWRGHITHVPSGERRYLKCLDDVPAFLEPYLQQMGVTIGYKRSLAEWLRRLRRHWTLRH